MTALRITGLRLDDGALGCFVIPELANERIEVVVRVAEDMVALVGVLTPSASPTPARR
jgi:hypothetical protein